MSMIQLQDTRIGQLLQTIRHKVDPPLQRRIRLIIKAWQKLLSSEYSHQFVIPIKTLDKSIPTSPKSNRTLTKILAQDKPKQSTDSVSIIYHLQMKGPGDENSVRLTMRNYPNSSPDKLHKVSSLKLSTYPTQQNESYIPNVSKRPKFADTILPIVSTSSVVQVSSPANLVNGSKCIDLEHRDIKCQEDSNTSVPQTVTAMASRLPIPQSFKPRMTNSMRLSKVKSTAELVQAAGDCIDSVTADRILTNKISKEVDPLPVCSLMQPIKSHLDRTNFSAHSSSRSVSASANQISHLMCNTFLDVKSEVYMKCKENPTGYEKNHRSSDSDRIAIPSLTVSVIENQSLLSYNSENISDQLFPKYVVNDSIPISQKVKKMKHKRHKGETKLSESSLRLHPKQLNGHQQRETTLPPVTNFMDDWPKLPSLPEDIDWHSLDRSSVTVCNNNSFMIIGNKSPDKCTVGTEVEYACIFPTNLHSVMLDGQYLHVLPWVDMIGYKRHFFPSCSDQELSDLTIMPEPW
ncbi:Mediator of RNA polymerase II transcription subunit 26 [Schistosoma japonicum]|uniref:Mediator of RNA polymerase II transcription subunit 26 n=1 Tax=Schistosoma japonicum TaxID=6182 RepID=A0A4Z2CKJ4_SCHJA|nr:Mediator of RNA polymerase II transcription subunit 26 [Schistosoma japonicum]